MTRESAVRLTTDCATWSSIIFCTFPLIVEAKVELSHRGSYMSAHVLLNLLNELGSMFNKFNNIKTINKNGKKSHFLKVNHFSISQHFPNVEV